MHTQTWVVQLFTCHIKHDVILEKAVARNKKLGGMSWNGQQKQDVVLEKAVARNKKKNGFLYETFEKMGPANKDSAP